jgi:hypothetical protein
MFSDLPGHFVLRYSPATGQRHVAIALGPNDGALGVGQFALAYVGLAEEPRRTSQGHQLRRRSVRGQRFSRVDAGFFICNSNLHL